MLWVLKLQTSQKKVPLFDLMQVENICLYTNNQFKVWYKTIQTRLKVRRAMATER